MIHMALVWQRERATRFENVFSPLHSEALAAREGIKLAMERGLHNVCFESDFLRIVSALRKLSIYRSYIGLIVEDSKILLAQITGEGFAHTLRQADEVPHHIARFAVHIGSTIPWLKEPPDILMGLLFEDCNL